MSEPEKHRIQLKYPLLVMKQGKGILACAYLDIEAFNQTEEACALVTGVSNHQQMLEAQVIAISETAKALGVTLQDTGSQALAKMSQEN